MRYETAIKRDRRKQAIGTVNVVVLGHSTERARARRKLSLKLVRTVEPRPPVDEAAVEATIARVCAEEARRNMQDWYWQSLDDENGPDDRDVCRDEDLMGPLQADQEDFVMAEAISRAKRGRRRGGYEAGEREMPADVHLWEDVDERSFCHTPPTMLVGTVAA